jgi:transposase
MGIGDAVCGIISVVCGKRAGVVRQIVGCFTGILTSDRWCGYNRYELEKRQLCWAHIIRDFEAMSISGPEGKAIGKALRKAARSMFRMWHRFRRWKENQEKQRIRAE